MDQVADIIVGDPFANRNFRHRLRFAGRELFEPDRSACDRLYDNGVRCFGILILENEFAGSPGIPSQIGFIDLRAVRCIKQAR